MNSSVSVAFILAIMPVRLRPATLHQNLDVVRIVLRETLFLAICGIAFGVPIALWLTRLTRSFLFGLEANDPTVLCGAALSLFAVCALAGWLPAWRAARIDPTIALRYE